MVVAMMVVGLAFTRAPAAGMETKTCTVRLRPEATVKGNGIVLADIAELSGDDQALLAKLASMPLGSVTEARLLSRKDVAELIRNAVADLGDLVFTGADFTRVSPAARAPGLGEIAAVLKSYLASVTSWREEEIEIRSIDNLKSIEVPEGDIQLHVVSRSVPANFRNALLQLEPLADGKPRRAFWVKADIGVRAQVIQIAKPVAFRGVLKPDDLREVVTDIEDPSAEYVRTTTDAVGRATRRSLRPGEFLTLRSLEDADLIRSGATVRLLVETGSLRMSVTARALQNGKLGERIKVRNMDSDRVIAAVVTGRGEVRVTN